jgi:hypothetical protein
MSTELTTPAQQLPKIREYNVGAALLAAQSKYALVEQLAIDAMSTADIDLRRKIVETLDKISVGQEPKQAQQVFMPVSFSIVLDDNVPQVAPPRRARAVLADVEDAVEVPTLGRPVAQDDAFSGLFADVDS